MEKKGAISINRLIDQTSPYLLQHACNPVDWFPWGREPFDKAQKENKPIFLSIGYSACHWCHVMAHESFEDARIADVLNRYFVPIKVDREERPDIDSLYMEMVGAITGSGGWPLSVFLTPQGKPFYGGTYFPPEAMGDRPGFYELLLAIHDAWSGRSRELLLSSEQLCDQTERLLSRQIENEISEDMLHNGYETLKQMFDEVNGGFGFAPKFPQPCALSFLLTYHYRTGNQKALEMVETTLQRMASGGICDHLGGGFHRYAVDDAWFEPHFEKMLYDQALLSRVYLQAWQMTGKEIYSRKVQDIFRYVMRDMTHPSGGFYSAEDADSEGQEGLFYLWNFDDIIMELGKDAGQVVASFYGLTPRGNFKGKNILHTPKTLEEISAEVERPATVVQEILRHGRQKLFQLRQRRVRPHRDEKIIAGWNGLMISSLAQAGAALGQPQYIEAASKAARFILQKLLVHGRLRRCYTMGRISEPGFLEDYSFLMQGLLDLYEAEFNPYWLSEALRLTEQMPRLFGDPQGGGFFFTGSDAEKLIVRQKIGYDGAIPSGNSAAALVLMKMGLLTGNTKYLEQGRKILHGFSGAMRTQGTGMCEMLIAADFALGPRRQIVIAGSQEDSNTRQFITMAHKRFMPRSVVLLHAQGSENTLLDEVNPFIRLQRPVAGKSAVYICEDFSCRQPLTSPADVQAALEKSVVGIMDGYAPAVEVRGASLPQVEKINKILT